MRLLTLLSVFTLTIVGLKSSIAQRTCQGLGLELTEERNEWCDRVGKTSSKVTATPSLGTPPYTFQWNDYNKQSTPTAHLREDQSYEVTVTDDLGCTETKSIHIEAQIQISFDITKNPCDRCSDGQVTANVSGYGAAPYVYRWSDNDNQTSPTAKSLSPGTYSVVISDNQGCYNIDTVTLSSSPSAIISEKKLPGIKVYPNPNSGNFFIENQESGQVDLQITNTMGELVQSQQILGNDRVYLNLDSYGKGLYFLKISQANLSRTIKVMVQ